VMPAQAGIQGEGWGLVFLFSNFAFCILHFTFPYIYPKSVRRFSIAAFSAALMATPGLDANGPCCSDSMRWRRAAATSGRHARDSDARRGPLAGDITPPGDGGSEGHRCISALRCATPPDGHAGRSAHARMLPGRPPATAERPPPERGGRSVRAAGPGPARL